MNTKLGTLDSVPLEIKEEARKYFISINSGQIATEEDWKPKSKEWDKMVKITNEFMIKHNLNIHKCYAIIEDYYWEYAFNHWL